jgi:hypothetical protein
MRPRRRQAGQVLVLFALSLFVLLAFVGLAVDGSRLFRARLGAQILADEAAAVAAEQIDVGPGSAVRAGGPPELIQGTGAGSAFAAAADYLAARAADPRLRWSITVRRREVEVDVEREIDLVFLYVLGPQTVAATSMATPLAGIATDGD